MAFERAEPVASAAVAYTLLPSDPPPHAPAPETPEPGSGDTTPCRMTGVTLPSHVRYKEI